MKKLAEKNTRTPSKSDQILWFSILAVSLLLNAFFLINKKSKAGEVLAGVSGQTFRWQDVSRENQLNLKKLDGVYYSLLKSEADRWAEKLLLSKEAAARGISAEEILKIEVKDKVPQPSPEEVNAVYAHSPPADAKPFPQVLKDIEADIFYQRVVEAEKNYRKTLFAKYGVQFKLKPPADHREPEQFNSQFPLYRPPLAGDGLNDQGTVVGPPSRGAGSSPVVLEVFSDFLCPYSKEFSGTLNEIQKKYPGKVRVVYHHFPLPSHEGADGMAQASACAQEQGKFWEIHDRLMASTDKQDKPALMKLADELGLEKTRFQSCLDSAKYKTWVDYETDTAKAIGFTGTPGFLVNGRASTGVMSMESLSKLVDWALKPSGPYPGAKVNLPEAVS